MTAAQEAAKQRVRSERIHRKTERCRVLVTILEMHESDSRQDIIYVKGLKFRIQKCRNELRNMGAPYQPNGAVLHEDEFERHNGNLDWL